MIVRQPPAAVFLDRDGTVIEEVGYLGRVDQVRLIPGTAAAIRRLNQGGIPVIIVTNQAGVARGYFTESRVERIHYHLQEMLAAQGATVDAIYFCPHHPEGNRKIYRRSCRCRKPEPGMVERAITELGLETCPRLFVVGDKESDMELARRIDAMAVLVFTGHGRDEYEEKIRHGERQPDYCTANLAAAIDWIMNRINPDAGTSPAISCTDEGARGGASRSPAPRPAAKENDT
ncbi:MAG: HAD family hydrolase [Deltaproteobacteria bacterium]|nr:HAD family hydrolase [Candidatus Anaeroferrophillacea bacterium]